MPETKELVVDSHCHMAYYASVTEGYAQYLGQMAAMTTRSEGWRQTVI